MNVQNVSHGVNRSSISSELHYRCLANEGSDPILCGSVVALEALRPIVRGYLKQEFRHGKLGAAIDDIVQETMIDGWRALSSGAIRGPTAKTPERRLLGWLCESARLRAFRTLRFSRREHEEVGDDIEDESILPLDELLDARASVAQVLKYESDEMSALLEHAQGSPITEIARILDKPEQEVWQMVARARYRLRQDRWFRK